MGSWDHKPMESDEALEWVANQIELPAVMAIKNTLEAFLAGRKAGRELEFTHFEAEAAVAFLTDYALPDKDGDAKRYYSISLGDFANQVGLWELASDAIKKIINDDLWMLEWAHPDIKKKYLNDILIKLSELSSHDWPTPR